MAPHAHGTVDPVGIRIRSCCDLAAWQLGHSGCKLAHALGLAVVNRHRYEWRGTKWSIST